MDEVHSDLLSDEQLFWFDILGDPSLVPTTSDVGKPESNLDGEGVEGLSRSKQRDRPTKESGRNRASITKRNRYFLEPDPDSVCHVCNSVGHFARECPEATEMDFIRCRECNKFGHTKLNCPELLCFRCDKKGHISSECPNHRSHKDKGEYRSRDRHERNEHYDRNRRYDQEESSGRRKYDRDDRYGERSYSRRYDYDDSYDRDYKSSSQRKQYKEERDHYDAHKSSRKEYRPMRNIVLDDDHRQKDPLLNRNTEEFYHSKDVRAGENYTHHGRKTYGTLLSDKIDSDREDRSGHRKKRDSKFEDRCIKTDRRHHHIEKDSIEKTDGPRAHKERGAFETDAPPLKSQRVTHHDNRDGSRFLVTTTYGGSDTHRIVKLGTNAKHSSSNMETEESNRRATKVQSGSKAYKGDHPWTVSSSSEEDIVSKYHAEIKRNAKSIPSYAENLFSIRPGDEETLADSRSISRRKDAETTDRRRMDRYDSRTSHRTTTHRYIEQPYERENYARSPEEQKPHRIENERNLQITSTAFSEGYSSNRIVKIQRK